MKIDLSFRYPQSKKLREHCLWKEILSQQRIRHFKILQSIHFAHDEGSISSYSNRISHTHSLRILFMSAMKEVALPLP